MPAHMIPPVPKEFDEKSDEGLVFKALKKLPEDYFVFHSVSITVVENNTLYEREIDFVVAHPKKGILCIEAKNGSGIWYDKTSRCWKYQNGTVMQHDGPYHQISTAKRAIISKIKCHANEDVQKLYGRCKVMHAVFFFKLAEVDFKKMQQKGLPEEADPRITMLAEDMINPTRKIADIFSLNLPAQAKYSADETKLTEDEFSLLLDSVLCPAFNLIPTPAAKNVAMIDNMNQLLYEQYKILDFIEEQESAVINGAAGTGKTMLAVEKARRHSIEGENVLFLCYNRLLCDKLIEVHKKCEQKSYRTQFKNVEFMTISKLAQEVTGNYKDYEGLLEWLIECINDKEKFKYQHVIVDEGQDFGLIDKTLGISSEDAEKSCSIIDALQEVVLSINGTFYLFYDKYQMIQGGEGVEYHLLDCVENSDCRLTLKHNCRNTKEIAKTSVTPLRDKKKKAIKPITACSWFEPVKPVMHLVSNEDKALKTLNRILKKYQEENITDIVILTQGKIDFSCIADTIYAQDVYGSGYYIYEYDGQEYRVSTCIKFKGLEADAIVLIDLDKNSFMGKKGMEFYVGTSRAKIRLDLICQLSPEEYYDVVHDLDPNAPKKNEEERMRRILGNTFSVDVKVD